MVITKLNGGLGNQMFQYAAARCIAYFSGEELKLDISIFDNYDLRVYELKHFNIVENFASNDEIHRLESNFFNCFKPYSRRTYVKEKHFHFDSEISKLRGNVLLDGYWQSQKYFAAIEAIIRTEFTVKDPLVGLSRELAQQIPEVSSVSVHVRRGDYVSNPVTNKVHGVCGPDYYDRCIRELTPKIEHPHFFIFSDDPDWVKENLKIDYPTSYVDHNGPEQAYDDLRLMSMCKHHIIANSSFSWWGAWLNPCSDKLVFAPRKWFATAKNDTKDLLPGYWQKM